MTIRKNSRNTTALALAVVSISTLSACTMTGNLFTPDRIDYKSATASSKAVGPTLDIPPDLSQIQRDSRYVIPSVGSKESGTITASDFNAKANVAPAAAATPVATTALSSLQGMRIERDGTQRWLVVPLSADVAWPKVKEFWQESGFLIVEESQQTGVMETDWAENRAKIPQDFLRKALGSVLDSLYSTGERDKFRTRLERRADGSTEIYISHRGAQEIVTGVQKDSTIWTARPNDPGLEADFLARLMVRLGAEPEKAKEIAAAAPVAELPPKAKLIKEGEIGTIQVDEGYDRAWRRVGLALDRVGFTVEDRDRTKGLYYVRYIDQDQDAKTKDGFFSRLFSSSDKAKDAKKYSISVKSTGNESIVRVLNADGLADSSMNAKKIVDLLLEQLK